MNRLVSIIVLIVLSIACAEALLTPRAFNERRYRPCQLDETENPVGKFCFRYCAKYRTLRADISENCTIWKTDVKDMTKESDFLEFRAGGFILVQESRIK